MMHQWCADSWTAGELIRFPPALSMAMGSGRPGLIKLNAVDLSQRWLSVHKDHLEIKLAISPQLLVFSAQVRKYTKNAKANIRHIKEIKKKK